MLEWFYVLIRLNTMQQRLNALLVGIYGWPFLDGTTLKPTMARPPYYVSPKGERGDIGICNPGPAHLAVCVDKIHAHYDRLKAAGVSFFSPPNAITAGVNKGGFTCYFYDPDYIVLEMVQPPPSRFEDG